MLVEVTPENKALHKIISAAYRVETSGIKEVLSNPVAEAQKIDLPLSAIATAMRIGTFLASFEIEEPHHDRLMNL